MSKYLSFSNNFHAKNIQKYKILIYETFWKSLTRLSRLLKVSSRPRLSRLVNTSQGHHHHHIPKVLDTHHISIHDIHLVPNTYSVVESYKMSGLLNSTVLYQKGYNS